MRRAGTYKPEPGWAAFLMKLAVALYWCGERPESARICRELLADARLPAEQRERVAKNLDYALGKI